MMMTTTTTLLVTTVAMLSISSLRTYVILLVIDTCYAMTDRNLTNVMLYLDLF